MTDAAAAQSLAQIGVHVSRETSARLVKYQELLMKWQGALNLVAPSTLPQAWERHFLDSAQVWPHAPQHARTWLDLGSGAGFPGLVLAALGAPDMTLVESDQRKAVFLRETARAMGLGSVRVAAQRIESLPPAPCDVITARALAPLSDLLRLAQPFWGAETVGLFLKGRNAPDELTEAAQVWQFEAKTIPSRTDPQGHLLRIRHVRPRTP